MGSRFIALIDAPASTPRRSIAAALAALIAAILVLSGSTAAAHEVGLSRGEYTLRGAVLSADVALARRELVGLVAGLDADHDGEISAGEIELGRDAIRGAFVDRIKVKGDGAPCPGALDRVELAEQDGVTVRARYTCPKAPEKLSIELAMLSDLPFGHRHVARAIAGKASVDAVLSQRAPSLDVAVVIDPAAPAPPAQQPYAGKLSFFWMGIQHILTGYDHLVFLLAVVLVGGKWRSILLVVTAFTVAHSITLGLAALDVWAPSPRFVEPAIALSIAYVGAENFFVADAGKRWRITFPFGLIHGFGFAGALREIAMPRGDVPAALVLFNLGVEAGQVGVLLVVLPIVFAARKREAFRGKGVRALSAAIIVAGLVWFALRVASPGA